MENVFEEILEKDEQVVKVLKPNKSRYFKSFFGMFYIPIFWPHLIVLMVLSLFTFPIWISKACNNTYYAYTNKRLIVRRGIFGNSYHSLEYKDITSTSVNVGFFDKSSKTGSLVFVNPSSHHEHPMCFAHIKNPYKEMNEIKEYITSLNKQ